MGRPNGLIWRLWQEFHNGLWKGFSSNEARSLPGVVPAMKPDQQAQGKLQHRLQQLERRKYSFIELVMRVKKRMYKKRMRERDFQLDLNPQGSTD